VNLGPNLTDTNLSGSGGTLGALLSLYDPTTGTGRIPGYMSTLDGIANDLVTTVNGAISGADANGPAAPPFFDPTGTTAATIALNPALSASGSNPPYTAAEANAAGQLAGGTADGNYDGFVTQIGADTQSAQNAQQTRQALLTAIGNQRESISGVSLDEEMTNLIQFQQAYQASARVMSTINSTMTSLLNMVGAG
jgi:flagellar hook-associated protein 1 FlgK